jgi:hypothetical protein
MHAVHERVDGPIPVPILDALVAHEAGITGRLARTLSQDDRHAVNRGGAGKAERKADQEHESSRHDDDPGLNAPRV